MKTRKIQSCCKILERLLKGRDGKVFKLLVDLVARCLTKKVRIFR